MKNEISIQELVDKHMASIDYSDDDIIIIDNLQTLSTPSAARIQMNMIAIAKKGKAQVSLNGHPVMFHENQLLLCPPNTTLTDVLSSPDFEFKAIFLTNRIIQSFLREKVNIWNEMMYIHKMHVVTLNEHAVNFFFNFYETLRMAIDAPKDENPYLSEVIQLLLRSALLGLCGSLKMMLPSETGTGRRQADTIFQHFLNLLNENHTKDHTITTYASELCVSPKYLTVVCKKCSGKTAGEWLREHIMEEIRYYLKQTDLSMKQISDLLAFPNPSFFGKYVKEHFGMTPAQFREHGNM